MAIREWERWSEWSDEYVRSFLRDEAFGVNHPMRKRIRSILGETQIKSVLDVGCGNGVDYEGIKRDGLNLDYTGIDVTPKMIHACRERYPEARFEVGDVFALKFSDSSFDAVLCKDVLCHLPEYVAPLSELFRVSRDLIIIGLFIPMDDAPTKVTCHISLSFISFLYIPVIFLGHEVLSLCRISRVRRIQSVISSWPNWYGETAK